MKNFETLISGHKYKNTEGKIVIVIELSGDRNRKYLFFGDDCNSYTKDGLLHYGETSEFDLVEHLGLAFAQSEPWPWVKNEGQLFEYGTYAFLNKSGNISMSLLNGPLNNNYTHCMKRDKYERMIQSTLPAPKDEVQEKINRIRSFVANAIRGTSHDSETINKDIDYLEQALKGGDNGK